MIVRPATADDVDEVAALEADLFGAGAWSASSVLEELTGPRRLSLVAELDGRVVGYVVTLAVGDAVDLQRVAVDAAYRRRGLARELLAAVRPATRMLLEVSADNQAALAFYATVGFAEIHRRRRYYRDGSDAVVMASDRGPEWRA